MRKPFGLPKGFFDASLSVLATFLLAIFAVDSRGSS